jgi:hypothetical protein
MINVLKQAVSMARALLNFTGSKLPAGKSGGQFFDPWDVVAHDRVFGVLFIPLLTSS